MLARKKVGYRLVGPGDLTQHVRHREAKCVDAAERHGSDLAADRGQPGNGLEIGPVTACEPAGFDRLQLRPRAGKWSQALQAAGTRAVVELRSCRCVRADVEAERRRELRGRDQRGVEYVVVDRARPGGLRRGRRIGAELAGESADQGQRDAGPDELPAIHSVLDVSVSTA
jgi:hypothetical protein